MASTALNPVCMTVAAAMTPLYMPIAIAAEFAPIATAPIAVPTAAIKSMLSVTHIPKSMSFLTNGWIALYAEAASSFTLPMRVDSLPSVVSAPALALPKNLPPSSVACWMANVSSVVVSFPSSIILRSSPCDLPVFSSRTCRGLKPALIIWLRSPPSSFPLDRA